jgi:hypothetical protein
VLLAIVAFEVDAWQDERVAVVRRFRRGAHQDVPRSTIDMRLRSRARRRPAGTVDDDVHTEIAPGGQSFRDVVVLNLAPADDESAAFSVDRFGPPTVVGIDGEQRRQCRQVPDQVGGR